MNYSVKRQLSNEEQANLAPYSALLAHLLFHRGISNAKEAHKFLNPNYDRDIHDPFLFKDMEKAVVRIILALKNNERIAIYADYDADGIPGAALMNDFMTRIGYKNYSIYIPHRHDEGFGLNKEAIEQLALEKVSLVITVDCGIADIEPVNRANELNIDVIITDHHEPPNPLPKAFAIIDHKQLDCTYPDKNLCGSAVAYKLIQGILAKERFGLKQGHEKWFLDLVGIATISDMVPLVGENRIFAHYGLTVLRKSPRKGISKLFDKLRLSRKHLVEDDISFMITPRINAASRMGVPMDAFKLLAAENEDDAEFYANHLDHINNERKGVVAQLVKEIKKTIRERYGEFPGVIVLGNPAWRPSLLGLAANTCAEEYDRPVFLWGRDGDNMIKGSCRSEGRTNIVELMRATPEGTFSQFGGHKHSGGFAVANDAIHYLEQKLNEAYAKNVQISRQLGDNAQSSDIDHLALSIDNSSDIDAELALDAVNWQLFNELSKLAPFGAGNHKPLFLFRNVVPISLRRFGKGNEHIELIFKKSQNGKVSAISFFGAETKWAKSFEPNKPVNMVASLEKSVFRGAPELRLRIEDIY